MIIMQPHMQKHLFSCGVVRREMESLVLLSLTSARSAGEGNAPAGKKTNVDDAPKSQVADSNETKLSDVLWILGSSSF